MFDLLRTCPLLRNQVTRGIVGFGINCELTDFHTGRAKNLDLVIGTIAPTGLDTGAARYSFEDIATRYGVLLTEEEVAELRMLPRAPLVPVGSIFVALEAKATMTEHRKALPRLHDELDSSHLTVHGHADHSIAAALAMVNIADRFASSDMNKFDMTAHGRSYKPQPQPAAANSTIEKLRQIRRRSRTGDAGFDAMGIVVVDFRNDGSPCVLVTSPPAPAPNDPDHYDQMIYRITSLYQTKFSGM